MHAPTGPTHTPATSRAASVSHIKLGGGLFRLRSASSAGVVLRGLLAGFLAGVTVRSPPTLSASRTRLGFFAVSLRRKLRRFCMPTIAESTLTSARVKSPGRPHAAARSGRDQGEIGPRSRQDRHRGQPPEPPPQLRCAARAARALLSIYSTLAPRVWSPEGSPEPAGLGSWACGAVGGRTGGCERWAL